MVFPTYSTNTNYDYCKEGIMTLSPQVVYDNLSHLGEVDVVVGASYREQAYVVLTDEEISARWKEVICDRLNRVNQLQALSTVGPDESY